VRVGQGLKYTLVVLNSGPAAAANTTVVDFLPGGVRLVTVASTQGSCSTAGRLVSCNLGTLPSGASETVAISVIPQTRGTITNTAAVAALTPDPNLANNAAVERTTVRP
jgi:uncharacterized repeat protein (TIGR01451 family)